MHKAKGGGYEDYPNTVLSFLDIENIHAMFESLDKLRKVTNDTIHSKHCSFFNTDWSDKAITERTIRDDSQLDWFDKKERLLISVFETVRHLAVYPGAVLVHCRYIG